MTVPNTIRKNVYVGDESTTEFDFTFKISKIEDVKVIITDLSTSLENEIPSGNFDLSVNNDYNGGTVTYPKSGSSEDPIGYSYSITVYREVSKIQDNIDVEKNEAFNPVLVENQFDILTMRCQEIDEILSRCLKTEIGLEKSFDEYITDINNTRDICLNYKNETEILLYAAGLPSDLTGQSGKMLIVKSTEDGYDFTTEATPFELVPVGTILPFYDFDETVSFNTDYFAYCNGQTISDASSPLDGLDVPDLSNRYLVGFGTEGGEDLGTAAWSVTPVGSASHISDLSHTHMGGNHTHGAGSYKFETAIYVESGSGLTINSVHGYNISGNSKNIVTMFANYARTPNTGSLFNVLTSIGSGSSGDKYYTKNGSGNSGSAGAFNTGSSLSSAQIQPRSISVRYIMRYK